MNGSADGRDTRRWPQRNAIAGSTWATRYSVALFTAAIALVLLIAGYVAEDRGVIVSAVVIVGGYALVAAIGGRTGSFRTLRGELDEREQRLDYRAHQVAVNATGLALIALWVRDIVNGVSGSVYPWLLAIMGVSYILSWLFYRWRER